MSSFARGPRCLQSWSIIRLQTTCCMQLRETEPQTLAGSALRFPSEHPALGEHALQVYLRFHASPPPQSDTHRKGRFHEMKHLLAAISGNDEAGTGHSFLQVWRYQHILVIARGLNLMQPTDTVPPRLLGRRAGKVRAGVVSENAGAICAQRPCSEVEVARARPGS